MIDFETLGTKPNSVVLSLGAVLFNDQGVLGEFYRVFNLLQGDRTKDGATVQWWAKQSPESREIFEQCKTGTDLSLLPEEFNKFVGTHRVQIWSNGADFDIPILNNIYDQYKATVPWKFWNHRCYRTLKSLFHIEAPFKFVGTKHNALADAHHQSQCLSHFLFSKEKGKQFFSGAVL